MSHEKSTFQEKLKQPLQIIKFAYKNIRMFCFSLKLKSWLRNFRRIKTRNKPVHIITQQLPFGLEIPSKCTLGQVTEKDLSAFCFDNRGGDRLSSTCL